MPQLVDSYGIPNFDSYQQVQGGFAPGFGQSFTSSIIQRLYSARFLLQKAGAPTGTAVAKIYNVSGTPGTNAVPTGSALATSGTINVASLTGTATVTEFFFTGTNAIPLGVGNYFVTFEYFGGDSSNYVNVAQDQSSPTHPGNEAGLVSGTWFENHSYDMIFFVYATPSTGGNALLLFI